MSIGNICQLYEPKAQFLDSLACPVASSRCLLLLVSPSWSALIRTYFHGLIVLSNQMTLSENLLYS